MFVSRKNLPFIHLIPTEPPARLYMLQSLHQSVELLRAAASCCKLFQPFAEHSIERLMLRFGQQARLLDQLFIGTEGDVFHTKAVYTFFVQPARLSFSPWERFEKELKTLKHLPVQPVDATPFNTLIRQSLPERNIPACRIPDNDRRSYSRSCGRCQTPCKVPPSPRRLAGEPQTAFFHPLLNTPSKASLPPFYGEKVSPMCPVQCVYLARSLEAVSVD